MGWSRRRRDGSALDVRDYTVETKFCQDCRQHYARVTGYVSKGDAPLAAYYAVCHGHPDHEVSLDVILGTWGVQDATDHGANRPSVREVLPFPASRAVKREGPQGRPGDDRAAVRRSSVTRSWTVVPPVPKGRTACRAAEFVDDARRRALALHGAC